MIDDLPDPGPMDEKKILAKMAHVTRMARTVARRFCRPDQSDPCWKQELQRNTDLRAQELLNKYHRDNKGIGWTTG